MKFLQSVAVTALVASFVSYAQGAAVARRSPTPTLVTDSITNIPVQAASASASLSSSTDTSAKSAAATPTNPCVPWEFLTTRGTNDTQTNPYWMRNLREGVMSRVLNGKLVETEYDSVDTGNLTIAAIINGAISLSSYANMRSFQCPETKFIVAAYSKGAGVQAMALQTMQGLGNKILGIVYWGSPWFQLNRQEDVGTATVGTGIYSALGFRTPAIWQGVTADICLEDDSVCTGTTKFLASNDTHQAYRDTEWETFSIDFLALKLNEAGYY